MGRFQATVTIVLTGLVSTCGQIGSQEVFSTFDAASQGSQALESGNGAVNITGAPQERRHGFEQGTYPNASSNTTPFLSAGRVRLLKENTGKYLNGLVEASVADKDQQLCNVAYLKTHKTGSTTLSTIFYRYGVRHGKQVARYGKELRPMEEAFPKILETCGGRVDVMHLHIGNHFNLGCTWETAREYYRTIMRDPDDINFVTIVREPREHMLSYFYCCMSPGMGYISIADYLENLEATGRRPIQLTNPLSGELGIATTGDLDDFVKNSFPQMKLIMLTNRFDEGLMVLRRLMGWHMIDMTYMTLRVTKVPTRRFLAGKKGTRFTKRPSFNELPVEVQNKIDEMTTLDKALYEACEKEFERVIAPLAQEVESDLVEFKKIRRQVEEYLNGNPLSSANKMYKFTDIFNTYPPAQPF